MSNNPLIVFNGEFSSDVIIPIDINYSGGQGRLSYYAVSQEGYDATGSFDAFYIKGTATTPIQDDLAPQIQLFLNSPGFTDGDLVDDTPILFVSLQDDYGINLSKSSIGHEIILEIDDGGRNTIILNDFFESLEGDNRRGQIIYQLPQLASGMHSLTVRAFDIANNFSSESISFEVSTDLNDIILDINNHPNPMIDQTSFDLTHTLLDGLIDVEIELFNLNGQLIHRISNRFLSQNGQINDIMWNINDMDGIETPSGIYLYAAKISNPVSGETIGSKLKKLMILK